MAGAEKHHRFDCAGNSPSNCKTGAALQMPDRNSRRRRYRASSNQRPWARKGTGRRDKQDQARSVHRGGRAATRSRKTASPRRPRLPHLFSTQPGSQDMTRGFPVLAGRNGERACAMRFAWHSPVRRRDFSCIPEQACASPALERSLSGRSISTCSPLGIRPVQLGDSHPSPYQ